MLKNLNPAYNEESSVQTSAGAPHNSQTQSSDDSSEKRSRWDEFLARLRSVRLVKSAKKLRDLRNDVNAWYPVVAAERQATEAELETATDPLDKAALKEELAAISVKVTKLDDGLEAINQRAKALVGDSES